MLIIGATYVDVKGFALGAYIPDGRNVGTVQIVAGGVCRNVAEDMAKLGMENNFVSLVDNTPLGAQIRDELASLGLKTDHVLSAEKGMGMWIAVLDNHGKLMGSISQQPRFDALEAYLIEHGEALMAATDGVVLEIDMNERIASRVLDLARRFSRPVYAIVANMGVILRHPEYLKRVSCFICNEIEAGQLLHENMAQATPEALLDAVERYTRAEEIPAMVVTMGEKGAVYVDNAARASGHCPALPVEVVDTTGAGDAFFSASVASLMKGESLPKAVQAGAELAARTLRVKGSSWQA